MRSDCFLIALLFFCTGIKSQNSTFSPYSRYGIGEVTPHTLSHNVGMGGAFVALKPDSTFPVFINTGNPAAYSLIKLTTLELGGRQQYSSFKSNSSAFQKWGTNFSYGVLGFPVRNNGGVCFGITPYSYVGYETQSKSQLEGVGNVTYQYNGEGGFNKAFLGYGIMPFYKRLFKFRRKYLFVADSLKTLGRSAFKLREFGNKALSDLSFGFNACYIFGNTGNITRIIYPNSALYNNTFRERNLSMGDFTGNFGVQTAFTIDSVRNWKGRKTKIEAEIKKLNERTELSADIVARQAARINDSIPLRRRAYKEKLKITLGYFSTVDNAMKVNYRTVAYNYILNGAGQEILSDTAYTTPNLKGGIVLPLEQGFGIGFKKGERLNAVADFAITHWRSFKLLNEVNEFKDNYRAAIGFNYVPEKYAGGRGSFYRRVNYRFGLAYNSGYITIKNTPVSDYSATLGFGIPVGASRFVSSMVNVALQYGQVGTTANGLVRENYFRLSFGFTFSDRWFQKFRYD